VSGRTGPDPRPGGPAQLQPTELVWLLRRTTRRFGVAVRHGLDQAGHSRLPQQGYWAVSALAEKEHTPGQLGERMQITKQAVSQLIETLVDLGYVQRQADPVDRRRVVMTLTAQGREAAGVIADAIARLRMEVGRTIGTDQVAHLEHLLAAFSDLESELGDEAPA
jgi:DNA-binding MarR family transcriptional regulator